MLGLKYGTVRLVDNDARLGQPDYPGLLPSGESMPFQRQTSAPSISWTKTGVFS